MGLPNGGAPRARCPEPSTAHARVQRSIRRPLDHGSIGYRIGEGHTQFDNVRAAAFERCNQRRRPVRRRIPCRDVRHQRGAAVHCTRRRTSTRSGSFPVHFRKILAVDIRVLVAASGQVYDERFSTRVRCLAQRLRNRVRRFERRNDPSVCASLTAAPSASPSRMPGILSPALVVQPRVLRSDQSVVEAGRYRVRQRHLPVIVLQQVAVGAMQHARRSAGESCRVLAQIR